MKAQRKFDPVTSIDEALSAFVEGARLHHAGAYIQDNRMTIDGVMRSNEGVDFIDEHCPTGRDILIPLLSHPEDIVQITAASALIPSRLELALQKIDEIHENSITEAFYSACHIKVNRDVFGDYVMGLCSFDPRYPPPRQRPRSLIDIEKS